MAGTTSKVEPHANRRSGAKLPVIVIGGATASGKSAAARDVAAQVGGVVINADSMQVYRELRVVTARPSEAEMGGVPHRLYGVLSGRDACSAGRWRDMAADEVAAARAAGQVPVLAGGTGLYLKAWMEGIAPVPDVPPAAVAAAEARLQDMGGAAFLADLAARDPESGARLRPTDSQRLVRAWSVLEHAGRPLGDWQRAARPADAGQVTPIVLLPPREEVYAACDRRFADMVKGGAIEEVAALLEMGLSPKLPVMRAVGVPQIAAYLAGDLSRAEMIARGQQATRQYAKRQFTWFRHQMPGAEILNAQYSESLQEKIFSKIRIFG